MTRGFVFHPSVRLWTLRLVIKTANCFWLFHLERTKIAGCRKERISSVTTIKCVGVTVCSCFLCLFALDCSHGFPFSIVRVRLESMPLERCRPDLATAPKNFFVYVRSNRPNELYKLCLACSVYSLCRHDLARTTVCSFSHVGTFPTPHLPQICLS